MMQDILYVMRFVLKLLATYIYIQTLHEYFVFTQFCSLREATIGEFYRKCLFSITQI